MKNGVPYNLAMDELEESEVMAHVVTFGELDGQVFDWKAAAWVPQS